jgi:hypothetical protein
MPCGTPTPQHATLTAPKRLINSARRLNRRRWLQRSRPGTNRLATAETCPGHLRSTVQCASCTRLVVVMDPHPKILQASPSVRRRTVQGNRQEFRWRGLRKSNRSTPRVWQCFEVLRGQRDHGGNASRGDIPEIVNLSILGTSKNVRHYPHMCCQTSE